MAHKDQIDQDALAAEWRLALDAGAATTLRIVPIMLITTACLFALKAIGLMCEGGYSLASRAPNKEPLVLSMPATSPSQVLQSQSLPLELASTRPSGPKLSWMQEMS